MGIFLVGELDLFKGQPPVMEAISAYVESVSAKDFLGILEKLAAGTPASEVIPDELVDELAIAGTPDECAAALKRYADAGVTEAGLSPVGMDPVQAAEVLANEVRPLLG